MYEGPSCSGSYGCRIYTYLCNQCQSPLMLRVRISIRERCTTLCDKVCKRLATVQWFSTDSPITSTNKTDHHDIAEILLKVALGNTKQSNSYLQYRTFYPYSSTMNTLLHSISNPPQCTLSYIISLYTIL